jgi:arylsulfatase A|tara:strand:+ start:240 stop:1661 length:1422 start_codon:yes stop_codon:yes gene_type:complete
MRIKSLTTLTIFIIATLSISIQAKSNRPNVVILLADDLGSGDLSCYGGPVNTPAIDSLAEEGTKFDVFYSGCAVCSPSRATLLTGRQHIRTGVYNWVFDQTQKQHLLERETTIAEILKGADYSTAHIGKWHLGLPFEGHNNYKPTPAQHGFDYWFATANNAEPSHLNPTNFIRNGKALGEIEGYSCQIVVDEAIDWLDNSRDPDVPFFLNVWFHEPHQKVAAPEDIVEAYQNPKQSEGLPKAQAKLASIYSATIDNTDRAIARLKQTLAEIAPLEDTLIIYASDNGSYLRNRNRSLRGNKGLNWEGGLRVPGIFNWPGTIPAGKTLNTPAGLVDILPTLCSLLDLDLPRDRHLDGANIAPLLLGNPTEFARPQPFFWHVHRSVPIVAIRDGKYSLVAKRDNSELSSANKTDEAWIPLIKTGAYKNYELYDLIQDPKQTTDLAKALPETVETLKAKLLEINASIMAEAPDWHLQ